MLAECRSSYLSGTTSNWCLDLLVHGPRENNLTASLALPGGTGYSHLSSRGVLGVSHLLVASDPLLCAETLKGNFGTADIGGSPRMIGKAVDGAQQTLVGWDLV